ncbi:MAG: flagellar export protein FliJ [Perlucidibaca sp.]
MKRSQRLHPVIELARRQEQEALAASGQAQRRVDEALGKLAQLQDYAEDYRQRASQPGGAVLDLVQLQSGRHFLERLHGAIRQQQAEVERLHRLAAQQRQAWIAARRHRDSLTDLAARYRGEELQAQEKAAQHRADDLACQRMMWMRRDDGQQAILSGELS